VKVWVLFSGGYEPEAIGVFSTEELAKQYATDHPDKVHDESTKTNRGWCIYPEEVDNP